MASRASNRMKRTWDTLAQRNAMHFIATERADWDVASFLASGQDMLRTILARAGVSTVHLSGTALDVGCGLGRISFALAGLYDSVIGVDISEEMIIRANELKRQLGIQNIGFVRNDGSALSDIPDASCDLVLSVLVLQHIPDRRVVLSYLREFGRVVKPDGYVIFQAPVYRQSLLVLPWRFFQAVFRSMLWRLEDTRLLSPESGVAFRGTRLRAGEIERLLNSINLTIVRVNRQKTTYRFCDDAMYCCRKSRPV